MRDQNIYTDDDSQARTHKDIQREEDLSTLCSSLHTRVHAFLSQEPPSPLLKQVQDRTRTCLDVFEQAFTKYSLEQLSVSYNGGKDCLVLLICYLASLHTCGGSNFTETSTYPTNSLQTSAALPSSLQSVYIQPSHPFKEVESFVKESSAQYHLSLASSRLPMKEAFAEYLTTHPKVKAIFVGTRRTDPHGQFLTHFDETDRGWPKFMRIHPVIDWRYQEIWAFIRHLEVPYCQLYDRGYTSLGGTTDTHPNPALRKQNLGQAADAGEAFFRPAYELLLDEEERLGRE